uniref:Uncharacterized protein n=1 Tax=virus sp. ctnRj46 TaxID=2826814 RepID=A0A8S5R7S9_9VIRU|nr:MAG TPA: hypothetical protein [virus sp. ctnRj46]
MIVVIFIEEAVCSIIYYLLNHILTILLLNYYLYRMKI